jgi:hypothetical protein
MELPIKFDIPKLSHSELLKICLPLVPGFVFSVNAAFAGLRPISWAATLGFGYKTGLILCVVSSYLLGAALIQITETLFSWIAKKLWPAKIMSGYDDPYWRHLMREYIGADQCPDAMLVSSDVAGNRLDKFVEGVPEAQESRAKVADKILELQKQFEEKLAEISRMPEGSEKARLADLLESIRLKKDELLKDRELTTIKQAQEYAWIQLSSAMIFTDSANPYEGFDSLMSALLTSSLIQLCFSIFIISERSVLLLLFSGALIVVAINARSEVYKLGRSHLQLNTKVISSLVQELKTRKDNA